MNYSRGMFYNYESETNFVNNDKFETIDFKDNSFVAISIPISVMNVLCKFHTVSKKKLREKCFGKFRN